MIYCTKHCCFYYVAKCPKCEAGDEPYLRTRDEVANPKEWAMFVKRGWVK